MGIDLSKYRKWEKTILAGKIVLCVVIVSLFVFYGFAAMIRQCSFRKTTYFPTFRSDPLILKAHVDYLCDQIGLRNADNISGLDKAADYIEKSMSIYTKRTDIQSWNASDNNFKNIIARFGPETGSRLVIGAHYDVCGKTKGADDNASGVAGLLELSRLMSLKQPQIPVELVAYSTEEPPFFGGSEMGSRIHSGSLRDNGVVVRGMICLEMIGYYADRQLDQPLYMKMIYPTRGDFIAVVGRWQDRKLGNDVKAGIKGAGGIKVVSYHGPYVSGFDLCDHRNYWLEGYTAVMVTNTAFLRNPNYHSIRDIPETLDYGKMAAVVDGVFNTAISFTD